MVTDLKHMILNKIEERHTSSNGKCGIMAVDICKALKVDYPDVRELFNELYQDKKFKVRDGIHGYLLFKI